jgi:hypothetical protein
MCLSAVRSWGGGRKCYGRSVFIYPCDLGSKFHGEGLVVRERAQNHLDLKLCVYQLFEAGGGGGYFFGGGF